VTARTMSPAADAVEAHADSPARSRLWSHLALAAVAIIAGILDFWDLGINGWGNPYYAAAVRSMTESWHAFRYASAPQRVLLPTDKPPR
jgi:4-amino-4-deoxy-L-arabinose transferase-like glycosyltransferase